MIKGLSFYREIEKPCKPKKNKNSNLFEIAKKHYINQFALMNIGNLIYFELNEEFINQELLVFEEFKNLNLIEYAFTDRKTIQVKTLYKPKPI